MNVANEWDGWNAIEREKTYSSALTLTCFDAYKGNWVVYYCCCCCCCLVWCFMLFSFLFFFSSLLYGCNLFPCIHSHTKTDAHRHTQTHTQTHVLSFIFNVLRAVGTKTMQYVVCSSCLIFSIHQFYMSGFMFAFVCVYIGEIISLSCSCTCSWIFWYALHCTCSMLPTFQCICVFVWFVCMYLCVCESVSVKDVCSNTSNNNKNNRHNSSGTSSWCQRWRRCQRQHRQTHKRSSVHNPSTHVQYNKADEQQ